MFIILLVTFNETWCYTNITNTPVCPSQKGHTKNSGSKIRFSKNRISYYPNSVSTVSLILSNDISTNPGPTVRVTPKCPICHKTVRSNNLRLECSKCHELVHYKCTGIAVNNITSRAPQSWLCIICTQTLLPFHNSRTIDNITEPSPNLDLTNNENQVLPTVNTSSSHTSIATINTQSLTSSFDEFSLMLTKNQFDIVPS